MRHLHCGTPKITPLVPYPGTTRRSHLLYPSALSLSRAYVASVVATAYGLGRRAPARAGEGRQDERITARGPGWMDPADRATTVPGAPRARASRPPIIRVPARPVVFQQRGASSAASPGARSSPSHARVGARDRAPSAKRACSEGVCKCKYATTPVSRRVAGECSALATTMAP